MKEEAFVTIHGDPWKLSDIHDQVTWARSQTWTQKTWDPRPALIHKNGGASSLYLGQHFDQTKIDLNPTGWTHDHCEICWWTLHSTPDEAEGIGYFDGKSWICQDCYNQFIREET